MKIMVIALAVVALLVIYKVARMYWRKADVEEKIEENKSVIEQAQEIKKEGKQNQAERAKEKIDGFVNSD